MAKNFVRNEIFEKKQNNNKMILNQRIFVISGKKIEMD